MISAIPEAGGAKLVRHAPAPSLAGVVECYWTLLVERPPATVKALPDGCCDLIIDWTAQPRAYLSGARVEAASYTHEKPTRLVGASFSPGAAFGLLGVAANLLDEQWTPLESLIGPAAEALAARVAEAESDSERLALLDTFLGARRRQQDTRVERAVAALEDPAISVEDVGRQAGASARNLSRLFDTWVGLSPKRLQRIVRAQAALRRISDGPGDLAALAAELGYADQPHLAREMRELFGAPPGELAEIFKRLSDSFNR